MPTRKDKTNVAPIYREQVFIPASGTTLMKQKARPKVAGRPVSSGAVEIVSPEFDLLTGIRGITNLPKGFLKTNKLPQGENLYYRQLNKSSKGLERAKQVGVIDTKSSGGASFTTSSGTTLRIGKTFDTPFFAKGSLWYNNVDDMDVIVGKDNPLLDWKMITQHGRVTENAMKAANRRTPFYNGATNQAPTELFELYRRYPGIGYRNVTHGFPTIPITGLNTAAEQMKCGGRRKAQLGLDIREGGIAIPIAPNMYYMNGRSHDNGGIAIGPNNKNGLEVEGGEVVKVGNKDIKVFSSVPLLRGVSPAQLVMGGANPDKVFKAQEDFKDRNRINDDGTRYQVGGNKAGTFSKEVRKLTDIEKMQLINDGYPVTPLTKSYNTLRTLGRFRTTLKKTYNPAQAFNSAVKGFMNDMDKTPTSWDAKYGSKKLRLIKSIYDRVIGNRGENIGITHHETEIKPTMKAGGICIKPSKRGTFTAAATKHGMGVQEFASKVLNNKENYSPAMVKKANFARNASRWKKEYGGDDTKTVALKRLRNKFTIAGNYGEGMFGGAGAGSIIMAQPEYVTDTITKKYLVPVTQNFNDAFGNAVNAGLDKFMFNNKWYTTEKGNNPNNNAAGAVRTQTVIVPIEHKEVKRRKKEYGGMIYTINGNVKNGLMSLRPKATAGKTIKIRDSYETVDETVERYKQLYRIKYGKEPSETDINRVAWTKSLENAIDGDPNLITGYAPNVGVRGPNVTKIVSGANKSRQIARTQTVVRNKNVKSAAPQKQAINTKVSQAARAERQSQFDAWQQGEAFKASTMPTDAVAVNRPTIGTGVRSGRKGRVDDVVAIERSQRSIDPLSSKSEFSVYDKAYAKKANNKMNQFANVLLASGTGGIIAGNMTYDDIVGDTIYNEELPVQNHIGVNNNQTNKSVNSNIKTQNKASNKTNINQNYIINGTFDNARPQYYAEKRLPIAGSQSIAEKAGLARSGWSFADSKSIDYSVPNIKNSISINNYKNASTTLGKRENKNVNTNKSSKSKSKLYEDAPIGKVANNKPNLTVEGIRNNAIEMTPTKAPLIKIDNTKIASPSTGGGTQLKDGRWIGQYKATNAGDWISLGSNVLGSILSYGLTKSAINKMPKPIKPVMTQAAKLKTRYNIEPQLTETREAEQMNRAAVRRNTQSSNTSLAREQRLLNEARGARNTLYGQKENIETQLINQDRLNRQSVMMDNVKTYNEYLNKLTATKMAQNEMRTANVNNLISGLTGSVNNILGTIESRRATNNTLRAIAAANPNVDARLIGGFDYYIDPITKRKYNKNQQYVGTING